jgi:4-hydroxy-tetrahydrodipicolinate reductase
MGRRLIAGVIEDPALDLAGATVRPGSDHLGQDAGLLGGVGAVGVATVADRGAAFAAAQVVVSFTPPDACLDDAQAARDAGVPLVVGTTGWQGDGRARLEEVSAHIAVVIAPNFSVGIWVLTRLVTDAASLLSDFDVELIELHHKHKADAPSGTALLLAEAAATARSTTLGDSGVFTRHGRTGSRPDGVIGLQSLRGGDATGEHTVMLLGDGERLELTHRTASRAAFVSGALRSAKWVVDRPAGLYSLADVLGS